MGYDLRITRAVDWSANQGFEISCREWLAVVAADPELVPDAVYGPYAVRFGGTHWLDWYEGNVFATDPDHAAVTKMLQIAASLSAAVQGDDGEFYSSANEWSRARKRG
jgi:hypothetical protein